MRVCFQLQVRPDRIDEYRARHAAVWPDMLEALADTGWRNYSLFLRADGLLIGYFETPSIVEAARPGWHAPRSTPGGRQRWRTSSRTSTGARRTRASWSWRRSSTWRTSCPRPPPMPCAAHATDQATEEKTDDDHLRRDRTTARGAGDRAPLLGVRQLRHPLQGVRHPGHPAHASQEKIADAATGAPLHRASPRRSRCTSRGTASTTTPPCGAYAEELGVRLGTVNSQHLPGRRLQARQPDPRRPDGPPEGDRPPPRVHRRHGRDRLARPQDLARRRHQLPGPGRHPRPPGPAGRVAGRRSTPALGERPAAGARVQVLRAGVLPHRRPGLGHVATPRCRALGDRAVVCLDTGHHAPGHQHRVHRRAAAAAREARLVRLQHPLLRRRRPDRRRGRPVPAVPDPVRGDPRRRLRRRQRRRVHARPVPQHRGEDPRPDPLGAQRAGDDRARAARRHATRWPRRRRTATCWPPTRSSWTPSTPTSVPTSPPGARSAACPADPMAAYLASGYQEQIEADRVGGTQAGWN